MKILILCDQIDCTFNDQVKHMVGVVENVCTHPKPVVVGTRPEEKAKTYVRFCLSKDKQVNG